MRLQRALARAGLASRRRAEDLIRAGEVKVNGKVAELGMSVDPVADVITLGRRRVRQVEHATVALHKPVGYVVTRRDPEGRTTVFSLLPSIAGLTYVGRLDVMTSGLLLMTNDGGLAHRLMHPRFQVERSYHARVHGLSESELRKALSAPIPIDGRPVNLLRFKVAPAVGSGNALDLTLSLAEGRYRIVRRMCERLDLKVERLMRLSYGPVRLGDLPSGQWRNLTPTELRALAAGRGD